jgi:hypothetical protein
MVHTVATFKIQLFSIKIKYNHKFTRRYTVSTAVKIKTEVFWVIHHVPMYVTANSLKKSAPLSSGQVPLKCLEPFTKIHGVITQKTAA